MKRFMAIMGLVLFFSIFLLQCGKEKTTTMPTTQIEQLELLPASSIAVGYIDFQSFTQSPFRDLLKENRYRHGDYSENYKEFVEATGVDIEKDVKEAYFSMVPQPEDAETAGLIVLRGNFDVNKITDFILKKDRKNKLKEEKYRQHRLFTFGEKKSGFAFAGANFLVGGNIELVKGWLDRKDGKSASASDLSNLELSIKKVKYKNGMWAVVNTKSFMNRLMKELEKQDKVPVIPAFRTLQMAHFSLIPGEELKFEGEGEFSDKESSKLFGDAIKGLLATAKLAMGSDRSVIDIINKIDINTDDHTVSVQFKLKKDELQQLLKKKKQIAAR